MLATELHGPSPQEDGTAAAPSMTPHAASPLLPEELQEQSQKMTSKTSLQEYTARFQHLVRNPLFQHDPVDEAVPDTELFEKDYIQSLRRRPYKSTARTWLWEGAGLGALILLPFGPVGFAAGAVLGVLLGLCFGLLVDLQKLRRKHSEAERQQMKIRHLMRWARFYFASSQDQLNVLLKVIFEYEALATMGGLSRTARHQLRLLYAFLQRNDVQHVLSVIEQKKGFCSVVFDVCIKCCAYLRRKPPPAVQRMEDLLISTPWLAELFHHAAQLNHKHKERAVKNNDWLVYADAGNLRAPALFWKQLGQNALVSPTRRALYPNVRRSAAKKPDTREAKDKDDEARPGFHVKPEGDYVVDFLPFDQSPRQDERAIKQEDLLSSASSLGESDFPSLPAVLRKEDSLRTRFLPQPLRRSTSSIPKRSPSTIKRKHTFTSPYHLVVAQSLKPGRWTPRPSVNPRLKTMYPSSPHLTAHDDTDHRAAGFEERSKADVHEPDTPTTLTTPTSIIETAVPSESHKENRLFRSLTDMIKFHPELKHQTPIGAYEMSFLTRLETIDRSSKEWECTVNKPACQVFKLKEDSPVVLVKAFATFAGLPASIVSHFIRHIPTRMKWDKTFEDYRLVEKNIEQNEIIYCLMKAPWPIANRDFLQWRRTEIQNDGATLIMMRSASHPDYPEKSGVIRAETIISGYVVRDTGNNSTSLFLVAQTDIRGLVPKFAVNQGAQRAPMQWTEALRKACEQYVKNSGTHLPNYSSTEPAF